MIHILEDKILYNSIAYACKEWHLELIQYIYDHVGKYAAILRDNMGRRYLIAAKRYIFFQKERPGIISFTKSLIIEAEKRKCQLLMLIRDADEDGFARNYIYCFSPKQILECHEGFDNIFNEQVFRNFPIYYAVNLSPVQRKEWTEIMVIKSGKPESKAELTVTRFCR